MAVNQELLPARRRFDPVELSIAVVGGLALAFTALFLCVVPLTASFTGSRDFVVFWATGQQLVHHGNPYDAAAMRQIELAAGLPAKYPVLFMRNPPWALPLVSPLGLVSVRIGALLWSLALLGCLLLSVRLLWIVAGRPENQFHWLGYSFGPALLCLFIGQTSLFALLGLALFLRLHGTRPLVAGASLWLGALKPHLFLPFGLVLILWVFTDRRYKLLAGAVLAMAASCGMTWLLDPSSWTSYFRMMRGSAVEKEFIPCLSDAFRLWFAPRSIWLQYLPAAIACIWALAYYWNRRKRWDWNSHGNLLMVVSVAVAPYCWLYDQCLVIPALLQGIYTTRARLLPALLAIASVVLYAQFCMVNVISALYLWAAPAWLAWYLYARGSAVKEAMPASAIPS